MKGRIILMAMGLFALVALAFGAGHMAEEGIHDPGTGLVEPELKEEAMGTGQGLTPPDEVAGDEADEEMETDYMAKADAFMMGLPENGFYLMTTDDLMNATEAEDEDLVILDVRPKELYDAGHIPGSMNIPDPELVPNMEMVPADKMVAVVCQIDTNSAFAVSVLRIFGDRDAWIVQGGVPGWIAAGGEVEVTTEVS